MEIVRSLIPVAEGRRDVKNETLRPLGADQELPMDGKGAESPTLLTRCFLDMYLVGMGFQYLGDVPVDYVAVMEEIPIASLVQYCLDNWFSHVYQAAGPAIKGLIPNRERTVTSDGHTKFSHQQCLFKNVDRSRTVRTYASVVTKLICFMRLPAEEEH